MSVASACARRSWLGEGRMWYTRRESGGKAFIAAVYRAPRRRARANYFRHPRASHSTAMSRTYISPRSPASKDGGGGIRLFCKTTPCKVEFCRPALVEFEQTHAGE